LVRALVTICLLVDAPEEAASATKELGRAGTRDLRQQALAIAANVGPFTQVEQDILEPDSIIESTVIVSLVQLRLVLMAEKASTGQVVACFGAERSKAFE
jgi:hypothetical protein